jgi:hypothetical protein
VENPAQADTGAQVYWLNCQPCHGDRPYEDGFTLPQTIPAVIGPQSLIRFASAADLYRYISQVMPFNAPGTLTEAEYWALTAFLMRANALPPAGTPSPSAPLEDAAVAAQIGLHGPLATATPAVTPTPAPTPNPRGPGWALPAGAGLAAIILAGIGLWLRRRAVSRSLKEQHGTYV